MAQEIERKFLIDSRPDWLNDHPASDLEQGYVVIADDAEVRVRKADERHMLTVKRGHGEIRREDEIELDAEQFAALWSLTESLRVSKRRYLVPLDGDLTAEVDVFHGRLDGLVVAEVEFSSEDRSASFQPPDWFGRELTGDGRYATASLAENGLPEVE
jgi:adenylate cyclase